MPKRTPLTYAKLTAAEFEAKVLALTKLASLEEMAYALSGLKITTVGTEVSHDNENLEASSGNGFMGSTLTGVQTIEDLTYLGVTAGGDWEVPVFYILFFNDKDELCKYFPKEGNVFNFLDNAAFGNDESTDEKAARLAYGKSAEDLMGSIEFNNVKIYHDIRKRFGIKKAPGMPV